MTATTSSPTIRIDKPGGAEEMKLVDLPIGEPGPGEIRIRHHACGLNFIDVYQRTGLYPFPMPLTLGMEAAGEIEAVGAGVTHLKAGDRAAYCSGPPGSYALARVMPAKNVVKLPDSIAYDTAAAMMLKGLTAQYLLKKTLPQGGLQAGDFVVFHAAAGGVGLIACQWARALGYRLIGTAGSDEKCALAREHGAAHTINYRTEDFVARVKEITGGQGVKVVYDSVGKDTFERSLDCLKPFGLMACFGSSSGPVPPFNVGTLAAKGSLYLTRATLFSHLSSQEATDAMAADLFDVVGSGKVRIRIDQRYPLAEAAQAHRDLEARKTTGCTILVP
ncbi:MAG: quinone oxidoreductase [Proteobacteria bacterium]|nr:quinone oxidoreductase [Pseudomonadota bacterium]